MTANSTLTPTDHDLLIGISTKLDIALNRVDDHETRLRDLEDDKQGRFKELSTRVSVIEARFWMTVGASAILGTGGGVAIARLFHWA